MALDTNLISYYKLDSNSNDSVSINNGTDTSVSYVAGKIGNCASFNGTTSYINIPDSSTLSFTNKIWSANVWFKTSQTTHGQFISKGAASKFEWSFYIGQAGAGRVGGEMWTSAGFSLWKGDTTAAYNDNSWHMATIVFNNAQPVIYIDGVAVAMSGSGSGGTSTDGTAPVNIGRRGDVAQYFSGDIDEVGIWSRALSASEITELYNGGNGLTYPFVSSIFIPRIMIL